MSLLAKTETKAVYYRHIVIPNLGGIINNRHISRFWHHRIAEVAIAISLVVCGLFALGYFEIINLNENARVPMAAAILGGITALTAIAMRMHTTHARLTEASVALYVLILATIVALVMVPTYGLTSPYIVLFAVAVAFAAYFGGTGLLATLAGVIVVSWWHLTHEITMQTAVFDAALLGVLPFCAGFILWSKNSADNTEDTPEDKAYHELATELSQVASKSEVVINAIADGVVALNSKGGIELINPAAQRIIGWGKQDAVGLSYKSVLKLVDAKNSEVLDINNPVEKALQENKTQSTDVFSLVASSGKSILTSFVITPIGPSGSGVIIVFRDITSEKAEERQQAEFISTASHEMRTPVASIEGYLGLALNPNTATIDEKARDFINKAHGAAQHLGRLFQDLLDVSKADDGRLTNNPKVVDVVPYVNEIATGLRAKAQEKGLHFIFKPLPEPTNEPHSKSIARNVAPVFYANVDNDHLREIVANLIENAIKYTRQGDVTIDVTGDNQNITISIADTGLGIPKEDQVHLFQKFYRVDNSETREIGGTGLGLYLCRRLAETIGGRLWVESEYKRGSTFFLQIPRTSHEEATRLIEQASVETERQPTAAVSAPAAPPAQQPVSQQPALQVPAPPPTPYQPPQPQPVYAPHPYQPPTSVQPPAPQPPLPANPSLSAIEADPRSYLQQRQPSISVPQRRE